MLRAKKVEDASGSQLAPFHLFNQLLLCNPLPRTPRGLTSHLCHNLSVFQVLPHFRIAVQMPSTRPGPVPSTCLTSWSRQGSAALGPKTQARSQPDAFAPTPYPFILEHAAPVAPAASGPGECLDLYSFVGTAVINTHTLVVFVSRRSLQWPGRGRRPGAGRDTALQCHSHFTQA